MNILDGKKISSDIKSEIKNCVLKNTKKGLRPPHLAAILVGNDGASLTYINSKIKSCDEVGYESSLYHYNIKISEQELLEKIDELNSNEKIDGYIVQLPLPRHINQNKVINRISPLKDVDGFHPQNFGSMSQGFDSFIPATPHGIIELIERYEIKTSGKSCLVIGRSNIVGRPISILMSQKSKFGNATVTLAHSNTKNLIEISKSADIIISALGIPEFLKSNMVKKGVVVIDVGITRVKDLTKKKGYKIVGDVDFEGVSKKASYITPVPGGVGPMTIAMLLKNTLRARNF